MKIAVFLRSGALGDQIMFFPVLYQIRTAYPHARIEFWTHSQTIGPLVLEEQLADEVFVDGAPFVDPVEWIRIKDGRDHWEKIGKPDLIFVYLTDLIGMDPKLEELRDYCRVFSTNWLTKDDVPQIRRFMRPLIEAGVPPVSREEWSAIDRRLLIERPRLAVVHPGSGYPAKCWPHYRALIRELQDRDYEVVVLCGPNDEQVVGRLHLDPAMVQRRGTVPQLSRLLDVAELYIGNDSGPTHLAAYLGTPTIALFGPTDPYIWRPAGPRVTVLRHCDHRDPEWIVVPSCQTFDCISQLSVERVLEVIAC